MERFVDAFERNIDYLRISVTDRCNLRCVYCMPPEGIELAGPDQILRYEEILRVVRIAAKHGVTKVRVTGGEPLVRKGIVEFISDMSAIEGIRDLSLTTNGVLLRDYAVRLKEAGLKRVNVSLDTLKKDRFAKIARADRLEDVLAGLDAAHCAGLSPVKINMVVIKGFNEDEVVDFARISKQKPYHVRYIEYMPFDTEAGWKKEDCISTRQIMELISAFEPMEPVTDGPGGAGPARRYKFKDAPGELGFISPVSEHFCGSCNRLRLTADGKLRNCLFSDKEIDVKSALRDGSPDSRIEDLLFRAVIEKPEKHMINENVFKKCSRTMSFIGG